MKIAQIVPSLLPTGPVQVSLDLAKIFSKMGHQVDVFYFDVKEGAQKVAGAKQIRFKDKNVFSGYDIVHSHGLRPDLFLNRNRKNIKAPLVTTLHNYVYEDLKHAYNKLTAFVFSKVWNRACSKHSACVVLSKDMRKYYQGFWLNQKLEVIYNTRIIKTLALQDLVLSKLEAFKKDRILLGTISSVNPRKGLGQILPLLKTESNFCWVHFGMGKDLNLLKAQVKKEKLEHQVYFAGFDVNANAYAVLFDVLLLPSLSEGFPLALLEAVQQKVPTVTTNIPVFEEVFSNQEVLKFTPENIAEMKKVILETIHQKDQLTQLALQRFKSEYAPEVIGAQYLKLFQKLIAEQS